MNPLYTIVTFTFIFVFILGLYGASTGLPAITVPIQQLTAPWPDLSCDIAGGFFKANCIATPFAIIGSFLFRLGAIIALIFGITFVLNTYTGLPFLGWFFGLLIFISAIEGWVLLRHGRPSSA